MNPLSTGPIILIAATAIVALALSQYSWRWRSIPGGFYFSLLMVAVSLFAFTNAGELNAISIPTKITWSKISYLGTVSIAPLWLLFAISYSQPAHRWTPRTMIALWIIPTLTLGLAATNQWHGLIWPTITPISPLPGARLIYTHGFGFWLHVAYAYGLMLIGTYLLIRSAWHSPRIFRQQAAALTTCALIPWVGNLLYLLNVDPWPGLDLTPCTLLISGLGIAWTFYRYQLFDIVPVARAVMFENLGDGVVVLDLQNRILDLNPIARQWLGVGDEVIGYNIFTTTQIDPAAIQYKNESRNRAQLVRQQNDEIHIYDLTISALHDLHGHLKGQLVLLHDISVEKRQNAQLTALQTISQAVASSLDVHQICETVVDMLRSTFGYNYASIYILKGEMLDLGDQAGYPPDHIFKHIPVTRGILGRTVRTRQTQFILDVSQDPDFLCASKEVESEICVPLLKGEEVLGTLNVESGHPRMLMETDVRLLTTLANQVVVAIVNAGLFQNERDQRELTEALWGVSLSLNESLDLETLLDRMLGEIKRVVPYDSASIYLLDENRERARAVRMTGHEQFGETLAQQRMSLVLEVAKTPNLCKMAETAKPVVIPDTSADPDWIQFAANIHMRSWAGAPILIKGAMAAFFSLGKDEPGFFQPEHALRLSAFAGQAAVAIENARLHEAEKKKNQRLEALYTATSMLISTLELNPLLEQILHAAVKAIPDSGKGTLMLVERKTHQLVVHNYVGYKSSDIGKVVFDLDGKGFAVKAVRERRPFLIVDVCQKPTLAYQGPNLEAQQVRSAVVAPLILKDQVLGTISIDSAQPNTFDEDDLQLLVGLAGIAALALHNAQLHRDVQQLSVTDPLTDCSNRRGLFDLGQREVNRAQRLKTSLTLLMIDLDGFKHINDSCGHVVGDRVLQRVAAEIRRGRRATDVIGRYGGDEFIILLPDTGLEDARLVAESLRIRISHLNFQVAVNLTVSMGVSALDPDSPDLENMIERADRALRHSKLAGRNKVSIDQYVYTPQL